MLDFATALSSIFRERGGLIVPRGVDGIGLPFGAAERSLILSAA